MDCTFYCGIVEKEQMKWHLVGRTLVRPTDSRTDILCGSVGGRSDARVTSPDINGPQP